MNLNKKFIELLPLKTQRLTIRETNLEDLNMLLKIDKQEETQRFLGGIKNKTKNERIQFIKNKINKFKEGYASSLTVCLKKEPIGFIELKIDENYKDAELSYIFDHDYCNQGYCTEASKELIVVAFNELKLNNIYADTIEDNKSSIKVLEKLGFKYIKTESKDNKNFNNYIKYNKINCRVILCGPAIGKTYLAEHDNHFVDIDGLRAAYKYGLIDSNSIDFEKGKLNRGKVINKDSMEFSKKLLQDTIDNNKIALISYHEDLVNYLIDNNIDYCLVYADISLRKEYINRMINRGNQENFIKEMTDEEKWIEFYNIDEKDTKPKYKIKLKKGQYLSDVKDYFK